MGSAVGEGVGSLVGVVGGVGVQARVPSHPSNSLSSPTVAILVPWSSNGSTSTALSPPPEPRPAPSAAWFEKGQKNTGSLYEPKTSSIAARISKRVQ